MTVDVQAPVEGAALQLVQQDVLSPEQRGRLALARMAEAGRDWRGPTQGHGAQRRGEAGRGDHSFVDRHLGQGLGYGHLAGGGHGHGGGRLQGLHPRGEARVRDRGRGGGGSEHHGD